MTAIFITVVLLLLVAVVWLYNRLIRNRNQADFSLRRALEAVTGVGSSTEIVE